jgi:hypothetical protein
MFMQSSRFLVPGLMLVLGCSVESRNSSVPPDAATTRVADEHFRFLLGNHDDITRAGLSFMSDNDSLNAPIKVIVTANRQVDWYPGNPGIDGAPHFDACRVQSSIEFIESRMEDAVVNLPTNWTSSQVAFGQLLHTVQDFYAHSNWVEIKEYQRANGLPSDRDLFTGTEYFYWPVGYDGERIAGMIVLGDTAPLATRLYRAVGDRIPYYSDGVSIPGLMTAGGDGNPDCPAYPIPMSHSDLNKDMIPMPFYAQAYSAAVAQTTQEFCRFVRLALLRHGDGIKDPFFRNFLVRNADCYCTARWNTTSPASSVNLNLIHHWSSDFSSLVPSGSETPFKPSVCAMRWLSK